MISNTFPGFGSMTVRNTNMMTMPSFVVMINNFPRKTTGKNRNTIICQYEKNNAQYVTDCEDVWPSYCMAFAVSVKPIYATMEFHIKLCTYQIVAIVVPSGRS